MKISELFYSIQGEGKRAGMPSFFIRTNYCNLRCKFKSGNLCDTSYTSWFPENKKNLGDVKLSSIIKEYKKYNCRDIVITGGEPAMYPEPLEELCIGLKKANQDCYITLETNGTYSGGFLKYINLISVSPKLKSSVPVKTVFEKMHEKQRINLKVLKEFNSLKYNKQSDVQWKFVFTVIRDIKEIKALQRAIGFENKDVYLMPEGITKKELDLKRQKVIKICLKNEYNYTDRLHILAWGNKRGV